MIDHTQLQMEIIIDHFHPKGEYLMEKEMIVEGMTCDGCANTVQSKLSALEGVKKVEVHREKNKVRINSDDEILISDLQTALEDTPYRIVG